MSLKHVTAAVLTTVALTAAAPAVAHASWQGELAAAGWAERLLNRHYPAYDFVASCNQYAGGRYWCMVSGENNRGCYRQGHADVRHTGRRWDVSWTLRDNC